jgi:tripeptidyl-peptidase-1
MKSTLFAAALVVLITNCDAAPTSARYALHEKRSASSRAWVRGERVESDAILPIRIGMTQNNLEDGPIHLMDV